MEDRDTSTKDLKVNEEGEKWINLFDTYGMRLRALHSKMRTRPITFPYHFPRLTPDV